MRARTRDMFKRGFKTKGMIPLTTFLRVYKVGDIVDIKANAAQQKGMPHKYYHGYVSVPTLGMRAGDGVRERCARGALRRTMDGGRERFAARSKTDEKHWRASSGLPGSKAVDERQAETLGRPVAARGGHRRFFAAGRRSAGGSVALYCVCRTGLARLPTLLDWIGGGIRRTPDT